MNCFYVMRIIGVILVHAKIVSSDKYSENQKRVTITSSTNIKYIEVPTSDNPVLIWMEVCRGKFPDVSNETSHITNVAVGEPVTLFIFFKDISNLYNIKVTDCWAYENKNIVLSKHKLYLSGNSSKSDKILSEWKKGYSKEIPNFIYASFTSFKFPDEDQIYLTCNIQLIGRGQTM